MKNFKLYFKITIVIALLTLLKLFANNESRLSAYLIALVLAFSITPLAILIIWYIVYGLVNIRNSFRRK